MRCSFRSTTALAAALALLSPVALLAETPLPAGKAAAMDAAAREDMPKRAASLDRELAGGLGPDGLSCLGGGARPCPDGEPLVTPEGLAVHLSQDGMIVLAPRPEQRAAAPAAKAADRGKSNAAAAAAAAGAGKPAAERRDRAEAKAERAAQPTRGEQAKAERQAAKAASAQSRAMPDAEALAVNLTEADAAAQAAAGEAEALAQAEPPAALTRRQERAQRQAARAAREAAAAEAAASEAAPDAEALAESLAQAEAPAAAPVVLPEAEEATGATEPEPVPQEPASETTQAAPAPAVVEPAPLAERSEPIPAPEPQEAPVVAEPVTPRSQPVPADAPPADPVVAEPQAGGAAPDAGALAEALAEAAGADAPVAPAPETAAAAAAAAATGQPVAPTPVEVDEETTRSLEQTLRQAAEARAPAAQRKQQQPAPTGPGTTAADAAAAAAAAGDAPVADALSAPATISDNATAVVVTEGSARSASEDFATRLTEGLSDEQRRQFQQLQQQLAGQQQQEGQQQDGQQQDGQPVVVDNGSEASDDDDNTERDLARLLLAGVGGYVLANALANNGQIALSTPDRVVVQQPDGTQTIIKDDNALLFQPGARVTTEDFADGSSRTIVTREDGSRVVTIRDANLRVLRRTLIGADGTVTELIDDSAPADPVVVADLPPAAQPIDLSGPVNEDALRAALARESAVDRRFTLSQIRNIPEVRGLVAPVEIDAITFDTGSAAIRPDQAQQLATLGKVISDYVRANPGEVFLIEGHTDSVGGAAMNLALSDRRAESVALALAQYFRVPPENMVVQGYGEQFLKVPQEGDIRANRRASVRRITDLLARG